MTASKSLKSLTFAVLPKAEVDPVQDRRNKTIARLEEQKKLFNNPAFTRTVRSSAKADDGSRSVLEKQQPIKPWWVSLSDGSCLFTVRSGLKPIEFDKGKSAIVVLSREKIPTTIDTLIAAVRNGELDEHLAANQTPKTVEKRTAAQ